MPAKRPEMNSSRLSSLSNKHLLGDMLDFLDSFRRKVESPLNIARLASTINFAIHWQMSHTQEKCLD